MSIQLAHRSPDLFSQDHYFLMRMLLYCIFSYFQQKKTSIIFYTPMPIRLKLLTFPEAVQYLRVFDLSTHVANENKNGDQ